jgi:hypothetical protein
MLRGIMGIFPGEEQSMPLPLPTSDDTSRVEARATVKTVLAVGY